MIAGGSTPVAGFAASSARAATERKNRRNMQPIVKAVALGQQVQTGRNRLTILQGVSFEIGPGEAVAILGASGSGKTSLLGLLAGLDVPTSGSVLIDGADLSTLDEDGRAALRRRTVGFVFQSFQLLPALTALEN